MEVTTGYVMAAIKQWQNISWNELANLSLLLAENNQKVEFTDFEEKKTYQSPVAVSCPLPAMMTASLGCAEMQMGREAHTRVTESSTVVA